MKKITYLSIFTIITCISVALFIQSCSSEDNLNSNSPSDFYTYLDFDKDKDMFSDENMNVLKEAEKRIDPFVVVSNGRFEMKLSSGEQIKISTDVFVYFSKSIDKINEMIESGEMVIIDGKPAKPMPISKGFPRLKKDQVEADDEKKYETDTKYHLWGTETNTTFDKDGALQYNQDNSSRQTTISHISYLAAGGASLLGNPATAAAIGALSASYTGSGQFCSDIIFNAAMDGGIRVQTLRHNMASGGVSIETTHVYDKNNKVIATFVF